MRIKLSNSKQIDIEIYRKNIKNLILKVYADGTVKLSVPLYIGDDEVQRFLNGKTDWLNKRLDKLHIKDTSKQCCWFMGEPYDLKIHYLPSERVTLKDNIITVGFGLFGSPYEVFDSWWREKAEICHKKYTKKWTEVFVQKDKHIIKPNISLRRMKSCWGSCTPKKNTIRLNYYLFAAPEECIDYIILHEMTHLLYPNHGKQFHNFISSNIPDWREKNELLNSQTFIIDMQNVEYALKTFLTQRNN